MSGLGHLRKYNRLEANPVKHGVLCDLVFTLFYVIFLCMILDMFGFRYKIELVLSRSGGTGRRARLKIVYLVYVGSIPTFGTEIPFYERDFFFKVLGVRY